MHRYRNFKTYTSTTTHQWLNIAHEGHKSRQAKEAQILEECQRYQHELDTCTRLEHLGRRWHEELQPAVSGKDDLPMGSFQEDPDQGTVTELDTGVRARTMNMVESFNAIHLRERFVRALEEKRRNDEWVNAINEWQPHKNLKEVDDSDNSRESDSANNGELVEPGEPTMDPQRYSYSPRKEERDALSKRAVKLLDILTGHVGPVLEVAFHHYEVLSLRLLGTVLLSTSGTCIREKANQKA